MKAPSRPPPVVGAGDVLPLGAVIGGDGCHGEESDATGGAGVCHGEFALVDCPAWVPGAVDQTWVGSEIDEPAGSIATVGSTTGTFDDVGVSHGFVAGSDGGGAALAKGEVVAAGAPNGDAGGGGAPHGLPADAGGLAAGAGGGGETVEGGAGIVGAGGVGAVP